MEEIKKLETRDRREESMGKPGVIEQARGTMDMILESIKSSYYLGMKERLEAAGYTCERLIEPPESDSYTVETNAPESVRMRFHNETMQDMDLAFKQDKCIPGSVRFFVRQMIKRNLKSEAEIERQERSDRTAGLIT